MVAITPDGEFIYVTRASTGNGVTVIETATNTVVDSLTRFVISNIDAAFGRHRNAARAVVVQLDFDRRKGVEGEGHVVIGLKVVPSLKTRR